MVVSSAVAVWQGVTTIATANVIGSNIANILLIVGISALLGRKLLVTKNLIDLDLPLLAISTVLMFGTLYDREVTFFESLILVVAFILYLLYSILHKADEETDSDKIEAQYQGGVAAGVTGTPTFFINGQKIIGAQPFSAFQTIIEAKLQ